MYPTVVSWADSRHRNRLLGILRAWRHCLRTRGLGEAPKSFWEAGEERGAARHDEERPREGRGPLSRPADGSNQHSSLITGPLTLFPSLFPPHSLRVFHRPGATRARGALVVEAALAFILIYPLDKLDSQMIARPEKLLHWFLLTRCRRSPVAVRTAQQDLSPKRSDESRSTALALWHRPPFAQQGEVQNPESRLRLYLL